MQSRSRTSSWGFVLDAPDARALARFYGDLLGWEKGADDPEWATLAAPDSAGYLAFQTSAEYTRPVWPPVEGRQQMMAHLDLEVDDLEAAVAEARALGAKLAEHQPQNHVRVLLDPAGHPFCLYVEG